MTLWAIKWVNAAPAEGWIDYRTISATRAMAWQRHDDANASANMSSPYMAKLKRQRRQGLIRAIKVIVMEAPHG